MTAKEPILRVNELSVTFPSREGDVNAVDRLSLEVFPDEVLGIVGESGSGKSVTSLSILRVLPKRSRIDGGTIVFRDGDTEIEMAQSSADGPEVRSVRGRRISMIFQEPMSAFSPLHTIGNQIGEAVALHNLPPGLKRSARKAESRLQTLDLLRSVGMPNPEQLIDSYPHELSGGMRQRALIAMGLACHPDILIADEPTTALDVTLQSQIIALLSRLRREQGMSIIFVTHDLGVIAEIADRVLVMYLGREMETAPVDDLFHNPKHPYTKALMRSMPTISGPLVALVPINGMVPNPTNLPSGCRFQTRCPERIAGLCDVHEPISVQVGPGHRVACFLAGSPRPEGRSDE